MQDTLTNQTTTTNNRTALIAFLDSLQIEHQTIDHPPVFTVAQGKEMQLDLPGAHTKNLFLKDDHKQLWLISTLQETTINLRALAKCLPAKNCRFAQADLLKTHLGVEPGSVTWFALINDTQHKVNAVLDKAIFDYDLVGFHPLVNTATTIVKPDALLKFADGLQHTYQLFDFTSL